MDQVPAAILQSCSKLNPPVFQRLSVIFEQTFHTLTQQTTADVNDLFDRNSSSAPAPSFVHFKTASGYISNNNLLKIGT